MKRVIATVNRPRPSDFDIVEKIGRHCHFDDGVFAHNDGEGDSYFQCELPRCDNGDLIAIGDLYEVEGDCVRVVAMSLCANFYCRFDVINGDGFLVKGLKSYHFDKAIW